VRLELDPLDFDDRAATGVVPGGATDAELRIVVPPGGSVELTALELSIAAATEVGLHFVSEAPGELTMTGVIVQLEDGEPAVVPLPADGLCPATPPGEGPAGESCYCGPCGRDRPVKRTDAILTDAGRPGSVATCPTCGAHRVRVGGRVVARAEHPALPRFQVPDRMVVRGPAMGPERHGPAVVARLRVDVPLVALDGIAARRADELRAAGIPDVVALAAADPATVAALPGISDKMARAFIAEAARLVRERGERVIFDV